MSVIFTEQHKEQFERDGFALVKGALSDAAVRVLKGLVVALASEESKQGSAHFYDNTGNTQRVWNLLNKNSAFSELIQMPLIMDTMDWLFRRDTIHHKYFLSSFQANILYPGANAQKIHIDTPVPEPLPPWIIKANSIWLLDDFTETNGATEVIPGSHKLPYKPKPGDEKRPDLIKVIAPAGSILFTHGALWHRSGANNSQKERIVLLGSFAASFAREIASEEDYFKVLDKKILANASDKLKLILGADHGIKQGSKIIDGY